LRDFWQKKGKRVPDKDDSLNPERDEGGVPLDSATDTNTGGAEPISIDAGRTKLAAELDDMKQTLLRRQADFDNYRKRIEKERGDDSRRTTGRLIEELIPIIDGFEHALAAHGAKEYENYRRGFELIYKQLVENVTKLGVERIDPVGKQFDPHLHQAMDRLETTDHPDGTIVQVFQPGYLFHGRTLRPAMVRVAVNAAPASNKTAN
jgi:molecular chaperone GrpE